MSVLDFAKLFNVVDICYIFSFFFLTGPKQQVDVKRNLELEDNIALV